VDLGTIAAWDGKRLSLWRCCKSACLWDRCIGRALHKAVRMVGEKMGAKSILRLYHHNNCNYFFTSHDISHLTLSKPAPNNCHLNHIFRQEMAETCRKDTKICSSVIDGWGWGGWWICRPKHPKPPSFYVSQGERERGFFWWDLG
jgi:hypothetical protein